MVLRELQIWILPKVHICIGRSILYKATTKYMNSGYEVNTELVALAVDDIENRIEPETTTWKKFDRGLRQST